MTCGKSIQRIQVSTFQVQGTVWIILNVPYTYKLSCLWMKEAHRIISQRMDFVKLLDCVIEHGFICEFILSTCLIHTLFIYFS